MRGPSPPPLPGALDAVGSSLVPLPPQDGGKRLALHLQSRASQLRVGCRLRSARPVVHTLFIPRFSCWLRSDLSLSLSLSSLFALSRYATVGLELANHPLVRRGGTALLITHGRPATFMVRSLCPRPVRWNGGLQGSDSASTGACRGARRCCRCCRCFRCVAAVALPRLKTWRCACAVRVCVARVFRAACTCQTTPISRPGTTTVRHCSESCLAQYPTFCQHVTCFYQLA